MLGGIVYQPFRLRRLQPNWCMYRCPHLGHVFKASNPLNSLTRSHLRVLNAPKSPEDIAAVPQTPSIVGGERRSATAQQVQRSNGSRAIHTAAGGQTQEA